MKGFSYIRKGLINKPVNGSGIQMKRKKLRLIDCRPVFLSMFKFSIRSQTIYFLTGRQKITIERRVRKLRRCFLPLSLSLSFFSRNHFRIDSAIPENSAMHVRPASRMQDDLLFLSRRGSSPGLPPTKATKKDVSRSGEEEE